MDRALPRWFAVAAAAALVVAIAVGWTMAQPPYKGIQRQRIDGQRQLARDVVVAEQQRFAEVERSLAYSEATRAWRREELLFTNEGQVQIGGLAKQREQQQRQLADAEARLAQAEQAAGGDLEQLRRRYVRLTGAPGGQHAGELDQLQELLEGPGSVADLQRQVDEQRHAIAASEWAAGEIRRPLEQAAATVAAYRAPLDRAEAQLARLEGWEIRVHEVERPDGVVERCLTCHPGLDQLELTHASLGPDHPYDGWGCTVCHGGNGRSLRAREAHRGLTLLPWTIGPEYTLEPLLDRLESSDLRERAEAGSALRRLTGQDFGFQDHAPPQERAVAVAAWRDWWNASRTFFRPPYPDGLDVWGRDASGRPETYTGSGDCLRCHEGRQRLHVERWQSTKFVTSTRLEQVDDDTPCLPCHATGYDERTGTIVQPGVTCEACHGPGAGYGAAMEAATKLEGAGQVEQAERLLDDVSSELRDRMARHNVCVECHDPFGVKDLAIEHLQ